MTTVIKVEEFIDRNEWHDHLFCITTNDGEYWIDASDRHRLQVYSGEPNKVGSISLNGEPRLVEIFTALVEKYLELSGVVEECRQQAMDRDLLT